MHPTKFIGEGSAPSCNPFPFYIPILTEKVPRSYTYRKWYPFHAPTENGAPFIHLQKMVPLSYTYRKWCPFPNIVHRKWYPFHHLPIFTCQGKRLPPGIHFFVNIGKFGPSYFREFQRIFMKLHRLTKLGMIHRFMHMNFCFEVKHEEIASLRDSGKKDD